RTDGLVGHWGLLSWVRFKAPRSQDRTLASATLRDPSLATNYRGSGLVLRRVAPVAHSALCISFWGARSSRFRVRPLPTGQTLAGRDDRIAGAAKIRTYDEAAQSSQSRHACRTQGARLQPFLPIPMGDRHSGEARLRFCLYRWRAWAVWPGPTRGSL